MIFHHKEVPVLEVKLWCHQSTYKKAVQGVQTDQEHNRLPLFGFQNLEEKSKFWSILQCFGLIFIIMDHL